MKLSIIPSVTVEGDFAFLEYKLETALDVYLFDDITYTHSEYTTDWDDLKDRLREEFEMGLYIHRSILYKEEGVIGKIMCNKEVVDRVKEYIASQEYVVKKDGFIVPKGEL